MLFKWGQRKRIFFAVLLVGLFQFHKDIFAQMVGSTYQIPWDVVNVSGQDAAAGTSYKLQETFGETVGGVTEGATYRLRQGYRQGTDPFLVTTVSANSCALGILDTSSVAGCRLTITTSTDAPGGYAVTVVSSGFVNQTNDPMAGVADGAITAGSEEYGASTEQSGQTIAQFTGGDITSANCTTGIAGPLSSFSAMSASAQTIVSASGPVATQAIDICIASAIAATTPSGGYADTLTFISTGQY